MKSKIIIAGLIAAATGLVATVALAQQDGCGMRGMQGKHGMRPDFSQLDADGDGQITKAEMQQHHMARFSKVDTDQDGVLSRAELEAEGRQRVEEHVSRMIERHDANGDGVLSPDEMARPEKAGKMFERLDADNSGGISEAEFKEVRAKMGERGHGKKMRDCDKAKE